ncbi:MAG: hypothetical protein ACXVYV_05865 [Gaiellales bacterium]
MSEYQVRVHLYDPPEAVRRIESKMACWRIASAPRMRGEDVRRAFEERLDKRTPEVVATAVQTQKGPRIRLIA